MKRSVGRERLEDEDGVAFEGGVVNRLLEIGERMRPAIGEFLQDLHVLGRLSEAAIACIGDVDIIVGLKEEDRGWFLGWFSMKSME